MGSSPILAKLWGVRRPDAISQTQHVTALSRPPRQFTCRRIVLNCDHLPNSTSVHFTSDGPVSAQCEVAQVLARPRLASPCGTHFWHSAALHFGVENLAPGEARTPDLRVSLSILTYKHDALTDCATGAIQPSGTDCDMSFSSLFIHFLFLYDKYSYRITISTNIRKCCYQHGSC